MRCRRLHSARSLVCLPKVSPQGLELLVTVLLARNRQPPMVAAGGPHAELAADSELISLPSGLLAMVCEAIVTLKVRLGGAAARACSGARTRAVCGVLEAPLVVSVLDALQVSEVVRARPDSQRTGPLRRSSRLSTLRARATSWKCRAFVLSAEEPKTAR